VLSTELWLDNTEEYHNQMVLTKRSEKEKLRDLTDRKDPNISNNEPHSRESSDNMQSSSIQPT
jgi:hypothetical protein